MSTVAVTKERRNRVARLLFGLTAALYSSFFANFGVAVRAATSDPSSATQQPSPQPDASKSFANSVGPLVNSSCAKCHNAALQSGDLNLQHLASFSDQDALGECDTLTAVADRIENGIMPPKSQPRPNTDLVRSALHWIHTSCGEGNGVLAATQMESGRGLKGAPPIPIAPSDSNQDVFDSVMKPVIRNTCSKCHNSADLAGDLDLTRYLSMSSGEALKDRFVWEMVEQKIESRQMPPPSRPRLDANDVASITHWIEGTYERLDAQAAPDPGYVIARRLNRHEYNNTIRDLLAINLNVSADFPPDPYAYGFDNVGDALSLSPALTEMYLKAAQRIARVAIQTGPAPTPISTKFDAATIGQRNHMDIEATFEAPVDATYDVKAGWDQVVPNGTVMSVALFVDGREVSEKTLTFVYSIDRTAYAFKVPMSQGPHKVDALMKVAPDSQQPKPFKGRLPYPTWLAVVGPHDPIPFTQTAAYKRIFFKGPPQAGNERAYERAIVQRLAYRAYRRPPTELELGQLIGLTSLVRKHGGDMYKQTQIVLEAILMSPEFLFRIEKKPTDQVPRPLSDYELASRLSYFLWSSMPDGELLAVAAKKQLHDPSVLHQQVQRMLRDSKADALAVNFAGEWLQTQNLQFEAPDAGTFPKFDVALRDDMVTETRLFFTHVLSQDRSILEFLDGKYTFVDERLAKFYGISGVTGPGFRQVSLEGSERGGILTQASVLTATSYPTRTSPTVRGKWILTNILNTPPPEPPANVPSLASEHSSGKPVSIRERLSEHRANPVCASCHSGMDPLGFALEHYNAIGEWRDTADGSPIDASGTLPDGTQFNGAGELQSMLLKQSDKFVNCLTEKLLTYSLGRGLTPRDQQAVHQIERKVREGDFRMSALIFGIVDSPAFQMEGVPPVTTPQVIGKSATAGLRQVPESRKRAADE